LSDKSATKDTVQATRAKYNSQKSGLNLADFLPDFDLEVVGRGEIPGAAANRPAQVQMVLMFAAARCARAEVTLDRNVSQRVQFAIDISRSHLLSFFTSHLFVCVPAGGYLRNSHTIVSIPRE
jgi:hypothetical protein